MTKLISVENIIIIIPHTARNILYYIITNMYVHCYKKLYFRRDIFFLFHNFLGRFFGGFFLSKCRNDWRHGWVEANNLTYCLLNRYTPVYTPRQKNKYILPSPNRTQRCDF